jgi:DNA-binding NtrC family response regulator
LESAAAANEFRSDLFYRLNVFPIKIPALRERGDDAVLIAEHFLDRFRRERKKPRLKLAADAIAALRAHSWPGNVRELQNVIERASILNDGELHAADLGLAANVRAASASVSASTSAGERAGDSLDGSLQEVSARAVESVERAKIEATLRECKWNKTEAAQRLGISYKTLLNKVHAYKLD